MTDDEKYPFPLCNEMASLAGIGYLMKNSGIEEVMQLIYKVNTTKAVLLGKDYERGVRVHGLIASDPS